MVKIDIIAGFLGAGKTTWINKMLNEAYDEKVVIIENEFGETGIDGELLSGFDAHVKEITSGCICCTLYGNFVVAIREMIKEIAPARILIEPTGLGRPNEIVRACQEAVREGLALINSVITIVDGTMFPVFKEMGGALYKDQIETAHLILLSHVEQDMEHEEVVREITQLNPRAYIISTPWETLSGLEVLTIAEELTQDPDNAPDGPDKSPGNNSVHGKDYHHGHAHHDNHHGHCHQEHGHQGGAAHHHHDNEGFSTIACHLSEPVPADKLASIFSCLSDNRYGEIFRAKYIVTLDNGQRVKGDYVYGKWLQVAYEGNGQDKAIFIGKNLSVPENIFAGEKTIKI